MDSTELEELADAIIDGVLQDAKGRAGSEAVFGAAWSAEASLADRKLHQLMCQKVDLQTAFHDLLLDYYGMESMETDAFFLHQELVVQPSIEQAETDAAVSNHEARIDAELQGGG